MVSAVTGAACAADGNQSISPTTCRNRAYFQHGLVDSMQAWEGRHFRLIGDDAVLVELEQTREWIGERLPYHRGGDSGRAIA
jgi:hypothetical protein